MKNKGMGPKLGHYVPILGPLPNIGKMVCPNIGTPTIPSQMGLPKNRAAPTVNAPNISPDYMHVWVCHGTIIIWICIKSQGFYDTWYFIFNTHTVRKSDFHWNCPLSYVDSLFYCLDGVRKYIRSVQCSGVSVVHAKDLFWGWLNIGPCPI